MENLILIIIIIAYIASAVYNYKFFKEKFNSGEYEWIENNMFDASPYIFMPIVNWYSSILIFRIKNDK